MFIDQYIGSMGSSDLRDDAHHHATEPLAAVGLAAAQMNSIGALLMRVKYMDATARKDFEGNPENLKQLLRMWVNEVSIRGAARKWVTINTERDEKTAKYLYVLVAQSSLAHWLDGNCKDCGGTGLVEHRACKSCGGSGTAPIKHKGAFLTDRIKDMVSELHEMETSFAGVANRWLRRI